MTYDSSYFSDNPKSSRLLLYLLVGIFNEQWNSQTYKTFMVKTKCLSSTEDDAAHEHDEL